LHEEDFILTDVHETRTLLPRAAVFGCAKIVPAERPVGKIVEEFDELVFDLLRSSDTGVGETASGEVAPWLAPGCAVAGCCGAVAPYAENGLTLTGEYGLPGFE